MQAVKRPPPSDPVMLVVVHDVTSVFLSDLELVVDGLKPLLGTRMSAAIVPRWRGTTRCRDNLPYRHLLDRFSERLLHGWTHQSHSWIRPISLLTDSADEFCGLSHAAILHRIENGRSDFRELTGTDAEGILAPAWQLPISARELNSFRYVIRFWRLESCDEEGHDRPLATSSWDWGRLGLLGYAGDWVAAIQRRYRNGVIPCIAIHPVDVRRGYFERAMKLIERLIRSGYRPVTASELLPVGGGQK